MRTKEYTFKSLFNSDFQVSGNNVHLNTIEIPIIQRDYAQGRKLHEISRIRERFLEALLWSITNNQHITLDFVYGDVSEKGVFTPLDGQQRLTTLFLLHWYAAKKEQVDQANYAFLERFTYATRFSSRDFCRELVRYKPDFSQETLAEQIEDQPWYPYEWKNDPTIQSMLVMIDDIHAKFNNQTNLWESLVTRKNIGFYFLPLSEMGLTDDLYIKMNSRGKPLTLFEHFKAEFQEIIREVSPDLAKEINTKFDIAWTDMLFPYRGDNHIIDDQFMRYFHFVSDIICYQSGEDLVKDEFALAGLLYSADNLHAKENIIYFKSALDCWCDTDIEGFFVNYFSKNTHEDQKVQLYQESVNLFQECCDNYGEYSGRNRRFPLSKMLLLFAVNVYKQNQHEISDDAFRRRIRMIRNLVLNSPDEIRDDRMKTLLNETEAIMLIGEIPVSQRGGDLGYNVLQKEEERLKTEWLNDNPHFRADLYHLEDHDLLRGCVSVVGLENSNHFRKFGLLFKNCSKDQINRALLSVGDYSQLISWRRQIGAVRNDSVWFDLLHPTKQRQGFENTSSILNTLLSKLDESDINDDNLELLIQDFLNNPDTPMDWRYYFVKYKPMRKGNFGMYYWKNREEEPYAIIMMNTEKSVGGMNWEVFCYTLFNQPEFAGQLSLGNYAYQEDKLKIKQSDIEIACFNDKYVVYQNPSAYEHPIEQKDNVDIEDRIEKGKRILEGLMFDADRQIM